MGTLHWTNAPDTKGSVRVKLYSKVPRLSFHFIETSDEIKL